MCVSVCVSTLQYNRPLTLADLNVHVHVQCDLTERYILHCNNQFLSINIADSINHKL